MAAIASAMDLGIVSSMMTAGCVGPVFSQISSRNPISQCGRLLRWENRGAGGSDLDDSFAAVNLGLQVAPSCPDQSVERNENHRSRRTRDMGSNHSLCTDDILAAKAAVQRTMIIPDLWLKMACSKEFDQIGCETLVVFMTF
jgi:hypothetical protein